MDWRNRIGLYGAYFLGMAGIGFTLPFLPLYLGERGLSDRAIGLISTLAALSALAQFPVGLWSDRSGRRKPFLVVALGLIVMATVLLPMARGPLLLGLLVVLFAENGVARAVVESLAGAEAAALARPEDVGAALGALRFWKPLGVVLMALAGGWLADRRGPGALLGPLAVVQGLAFGFAWLIHDRGRSLPAPVQPRPGPQARAGLLHDRALWVFVAAMVLFHAANAPGGVYLGLFLRRTLHAPERMLAYAFVASMAAWMLVVRPAGRLADRVGRRPLLIACWAIMALRLALVALARTAGQIVAIQACDGLANGLFAVLAAAWVTDRLADPRRAGEAQVLVGCSLVLGSAIGPAASAMAVGTLGYRGLFLALAALGGVATAIVAAFVPETLPGKASNIVPSWQVGPMGTVSDLAPTP